MIRRLDVEYRQSARDDLDGIFRFIVENGASIEVALNFVLRIEHRCQKSETLPAAAGPETIFSRDSAQFRSSIRLSSPM